MHLVINRFSHLNLQESHIFPYCPLRAPWFWAYQQTGLHCWKTEILLYILPWLQTPAIQQLNFWTVHLARTRTNTDEPVTFCSFRKYSWCSHNLRKSTKLNYWNCLQEWGLAVLFSAFLIAFVMGGKKAIVVLVDSWKTVTYYYINKKILVLGRLKRNGNIKATGLQLSQNLLHTK